MPSAWRFFRTFVLRRLPQVREATIREALALERMERVAIEIAEGLLLDLELGVDQVLDLHQEPRVDLREAVDVLERHSHAERIRHVPEALAARVRELVLDLVHVHGLEVEAVDAVSRPRSAFCSDSWKLRPIAITSPTLFICVVRRSSACGNFSKAKRGTFVTT
jgi:hypothetical protein